MKTEKGRAKMDEMPTNLKNKPLKRSHHPERITLSDPSLIKLDHWMGAVHAVLKGSRFSRSDMINWFIERATAELSQSEIKLIRDKYFDPHKALEWALQQIKQAQKQGQKVDAKNLLKEIMDHAETSQRKKTHDKLGSKNDQSKPGAEIP